MSFKDEIKKIQENKKIIKTTCSPVTRAKYLDLAKHYANDIANSITKKIKEDAVLGRKHPYRYISFFGKKATKDSYLAETGIVFNFDFNQDVFTAVENKYRYDDFFPTVRYEFVLNDKSVAVYMISVLCEILKQNDIYPITTIQKTTWSETCYVNAIDEHIFDEFNKEYEFVLEHATEPIMSKVAVFEVRFAYIED